MNEELTPLQALKEFVKLNYKSDNCYEDELINIIETALKALEIIKNKQVDVALFIDTIHDDIETHNYYCISGGELTEEEHKLLSEVLL